MRIQYKGGIIDRILHQGDPTMRRLLILLAVLFPVVLVSRSFWSLVGMEFAYTPVTYRFDDGTTQEAQLGPMAHWPDWAIRPVGAVLTVEAWYGPSPNHTPVGHGVLEIRQNVRSVLADYETALRAAGWDVERTSLVFPLATDPPRSLELCVVTARMASDSRLLQASFDLSPSPGSTSMHWYATATEGWLNKKGPAC